VQHLELKERGLKKKKKKRKEYGCFGHTDLVEKKGGAG